MTMRRVLIALIRAYQYLLAPWWGRQCRFTPTCSHYADRGAGAPRGPGRIVARREADPALPPVEPGWLRSRPVTPAPTLPEDRLLMDIQRLIAFVVFSFSALLLWDAWQKHNAPKAPAAAIPSPAARHAGCRADAVPLRAAPAPSTASAPAATRRARLRRSVRCATGQPVIVKTDLFEVELNTAGGDIRRVTLFKVFSALDRTKPLTLLAPDPKQYFVTQSGLLGEGLPSHKAVYTRRSRTRSRCADGKDQVEVRLVAKDATGAEVVKKLRLPPRHLRDPRHLRGEERGRQAARAVRLLPVPARRQPAEPGSRADERRSPAWPPSPARRSTPTSRSS